MMGSSSGEAGAYYVSCDNGAQTVVNPTGPTFMVDPSWKGPFATRADAGNFLSNQVCQTSDTVPSSVPHSADHARQARLQRAQAKVRVRVAS
jgi:hypothetical protein